MKIAYLTTRFPKLSETFIYREINALRKSGLIIKTYSNNRPYKEDIIGELVKYKEETFYILPPNFFDFIRSNFYWLIRKTKVYFQILLCLIFQPKPTIKDHFYTIFHFFEGVYLAKKLKTDGIDHVHVHLATGAVTVALIASKLNGITYSFTAHGSALLLKAVLLNMKVNNALFVIAISKFNRDYLIKKVGEAVSPKIFVIKCGVDINKFKPICKVKHDAQPLQFLAVGRLIPQKAQHVMIEAFAKIRKSGQVAVLKIIGEGPCRLFLEGEIKRFNLNKEVILFGSKTSSFVRHAYSEADIFLNSSVSEGIPITLMEAMSCGLPVVASRISGIPELIENGKDGVLVEPHDSKAMAIAMCNLVKDMTLRQELGKNARAKIISDFDVYQNSKKLYQLFNKMLSRDVLNDSL